MSDRLFPLDEVPEVPLFREPRRARGAQIMDERLNHDYPPEWNKCPTCAGRGTLWSEIQPGMPSDQIAARNVEYVWIVSGSLRDGVIEGTEVSSPTRYPRDEMGSYVGFRVRDAVCGACLGMGSVKARVRLEAGHRCVRCLHPFMTKGDAKMLGVEPSPGRWSPCDEKCTHFSPIRLGEGEPLTHTPMAGKLAAEHPGEVFAEWRVLTVHHLDGDKSNLAWYNLAALDQRCHLEIQARVVMERIYPHEHSAWFQPFVAGYYAKVYLGLDLTREETLSRLDELLALERAA